MSDHDFDNCDTKQLVKGGPLPRRAVELLSAKDAAVYLYMSGGQLARLRAKGEGPGHYRRGREIFYDISDLEEWQYIRRLDALAASQW
jgi:hypothetical protein